MGWKGWLRTVAGTALAVACVVAGAAAKARADRPTPRVFERTVTCAVAQLPTSEPPTGLAGEQCLPKYVDAARRECGPGVDAVVLTFTLVQKDPDNADPAKLRGEPTLDCRAGASPT